MNTVIPGNIFREYDIRGVADTELASPIACEIAKGFGTWLAAHEVKKAAIGGDVRISTPRIRESFINGLLETGIDVVDIGIVTTPILYWSLYHLNLEGGVMITGSHNPRDMNGVKLVYGKATLWGKEIQDVQSVVLSGNFVKPGRAGQLTRLDIGDAYIDMLASKIELAPTSDKLVVGYDCGNGTAGLYFSKFLSKIGVSGLPLFEEPDGCFPNHHPDPQKRENLQHLISLVRSKRADVGIAFDGDADRIGVVDERGEVIWGDRLMALYWGEILEKHPGADVLVEVKCSMALPEEAEKRGGNPIFCQGGHSVMKAKMREVGALFGGEYSGHMFFADEYYGFDDPFYAAGRLFRIMTSNRPKSLSDIMQCIPEYPTTQESRIDCADDVKFALIENVKKKLEGKNDLITCDGVRIVYPDGWGLIRASNTQPVITTRCEGRTKEALDRISTLVKKLILDEGLSDFEWEY
ncbi:MAG: phosphomannomutase/phosphoglucomutase [Synergistaceae bacterium]|nr:phosphomannomutase/phosphoglucomutase [Synergistaceae bacterium]